MTVRDELIEFIQRCGLEGLGEIAGDTALISSGLLDSLALFNLVVWVEERIGVPLDPTTVDLTTEWATVDELARFVEARGGARAPATPRSR
jgi:acyl carrier protein